MLLIKIAIGIIVLLVTRIIYMEVRYSWGFHIRKDNFENGWSWKVFKEHFDFGLFFYFYLPIILIAIGLIIIL